MSYLTTGRFSIRLVCGVSVMLLCLGASCRKSQTAVKPEITLAGQLDSMVVDGVGVSLFDGESMGLWKETPFEQQGKSYVEDGRMLMTQGMDMSSVTWTGPLVRMDYEISLQAMRVEGVDFFCGLTFPVKEEPCTLVIGGWGGTVVGLSNIDYYDAMNNETARMREFENNRWYDIRLRVTQEKIQAWIDDEMVVDFAWPGHKLDIRMEVDLSAPLGIATWQTTGAVKNIEIRKVDEPAESPDPWY